MFVVVNIDTEGPTTIRHNKDWDAVRGEVASTTSASFRARFADSNGRPAVFNWFVVHWIAEHHRGIGRDVGFHRILDEYVPRVADARKAGFEDELHWHYHHVHLNDEYDNRNWLDTPMYDEIISRVLLERDYFPTCYRAGNTWEDTAASQWLEQWIPFDFSNRSPQRGFNFDWSNAPTAWSIYSPDTVDVQREGTQRRVMGRSISIENGWFRQEEVEAAFLRARGGEDSYVSFFTHDYNEMTRYIEEGLSLVAKVAREFPEVSFHNVSALEAMRQLSHREIGSELRLSCEKTKTHVDLWANQPIFNPYPWIAVRRMSGEVDRLIPERLHVPRPTWRVHLSTMQGSPIVQAAAACTTPEGQSTVLRLL
ncbi:MAG: hypothetical protein IPK60_02800 [Sandaracinaceae bacterium]|nr:hypothetical protein [Sandaracinaceae bacterium]